MVLRLLYCLLQEVSYPPTARCYNTDANSYRHSRALEYRVDCYFADVGSDRWDYRYRCVLALRHVCQPLFWQSRWNLPAGYSAEFFRQAPPEDRLSLKSFVSGSHLLIIQIQNRLTRFCKKRFQHFFNRYLRNKEGYFHGVILAF